MMDDGELWAAQQNCRWLVNMKMELGQSILDRVQLAACLHYQKAPRTILCWPICLKGSISLHLSTYRVSLYHLMVNTACHGLEFHLIDKVLLTWVHQTGREITVLVCCRSYSSVKPFNFWGAELLLPLPASAELKKMVSVTNVIARKSADLAHWLSHDWVSELHV